MPVRRRKRVRKVVQMTTEALAVLWLIPAAIAAFLGLVARYLRTSGLAHGAKLRAFCRIVIDDFGSFHSRCGGDVARLPALGARWMAALAALLALSWPFYAFGIIRGALPTPKTAFEHWCQVAFVWVMAMGGVLVGSSLAFILLRYGGTVTR